MRLIRKTPASWTQTLLVPVARGAHLIVAMPAGEQYSIIVNFIERLLSYLVFGEDPVSLGNGHDVVVDREGYPGTKSSADAANVFHTLTPHINLNF